MSKLDDMSIVPEFTDAARGQVEQPPPATPQLKLELSPEGAVVQQVHQEIEAKKRALVSPQLRESEAPQPHKQHLLLKREFLRVRGGVFDYGWEKKTMETAEAAPPADSAQAKLKKCEERMHARRQRDRGEKENDHERE